MKVFYRILFVLLSVFFILGCEDENKPECNGGNCSPRVECRSDDDCSYDDLLKHNTVCNYRIGYCDVDLCEDMECGLGKCVHGDNPETKDEFEEFYCQCDEGAQFYVHNDIKLCVPKCKTNDDCNYEHGMNYQYCDTELGNCVFNNPNN